jgi:catechol 2,3-dioxygenase-like lactoylglutathione lyase family enzyme
MIEVHAYIEVADLERGIAFYCEGLDLSLKRRHSAGWVEFGGANLPIFLLGNRPPTAELAAPGYSAALPAIGHRCISISSFRISTLPSRG